jgi:pimeloyl-ACP methyl ester carboxylesterase
MKKNIYFFGIFFLGLLIASALFESLIYFQLGSRVSTLHSFLGWYVLILIINLVVLFVLLKYYHYKKYWFAFSTGIIFTIAGLFNFIIIFSMLAIGELGDYYTIAILIILGTGFLHYISLLFSPAGKRPWLKTAGIVGSILMVILLLAFIRYMNSQDSQIKVALDKIINWASMVGGILLPMLYIMNFLSESRVLKPDYENRRLQNRFKELMVFVGVIAFSASIFFAGKLAGESRAALKWINRGPERAQKLAQPFEARSYMNSQGDILLYRLMKPLDYDPNKKYPLVVCLHGGGGWGTDNVKQIDGSWAAQMLTEQYNRKEYPAFIFVPQCPPGFSWGGGIPNYPGIDKLVFETISSLEEEFEIHDKRRYVMGGSLGGYGSWQFISTRPNMFAAAVPICGGGDPDLAQNIVDVPVWAFHGAKDRNVPVRRSREMIDAIKKAGGNPKYTEYPDAGHIISTQVRETSDLLDWLFAQKRD